jgi:hypothetical protein
MRLPLVVSAFSPAFFAVILLSGLLPVSVVAFSGVASPAVSRRNFPLSRFYDTPDPLPGGHAGHLIRSQEFDEYDVPLHVNAVRILFHSRSATGQDVAASGVVLFPDAKPPSGGWPVIAWAHSLTGVARDCAPSLERNLGDGAVLTMYVNLGYAVVATDYAGLGTAFRNAFSDAPSNATDVISSVPAARAAVPQLGSRWVAIGVQEGGTVAVKVAEMENSTGDENFLGSIAVSSLDDSQDRYGANSSGTSGNALFLAYGIKTVFPQFDPKMMLTGKGMQLYAALEKSCGDPNAESKLSPNEMQKPGWQRNNFVQQFLERSSLGRQTAAGPLLVISSELDPATPIQRTGLVIRRMCSQADHVDFEPYAQSDPGHVFGDSVREQISWLQARFSGKLAPSNCAQQ